MRRTDDAAATSAAGDDCRGFVVTPAVRAETLPLLRERVRAGLWILLIAGPVFTIGDVVYHREWLQLMLLLKVCYFVAVLTGFWAMRGAPAWDRCVATALLVAAGVEGVLAVSDVFVADRATTFLLVSLITVVTASLLPWGVRPQLASTAIAWAAILWNVLLIPEPDGPMDPPVISALGATVTSLYVAAAFHRARMERRRAEAQLRDSEALKTAIVDASLDAVITIDEDARIAGFNPAAERIFGLEAAQALGRDLSAWLDPLDAEDGVRPAIAAGLAGGDRARLGRRIEMRAIRADGSHLPVEVAVSSIDRRGPALFTVYVRDLRERRLAEEAETSAALVRVGHEMTHLLDTSLVVERLQALALELLHADRVTTLLCAPDGAAFVPGASCAPVPFEAVRPLLARVEDDHVLVLGDAAPEALPPVVAALVGGARTVTVLSLWQGSDVLGVALAAWDVREAAFSPRERRLACGIAQSASMALANARLVEALARASRVKTEFLSTMTHELRTPIHVVLGFAEMAADATLDMAEREALLHRIPGVGRELLALVENALDVGKLEAGRSDVVLTPVPLATFWAELGGSCARMHRNAGVALRWQGDVPDATFPTDTRKLSAIVSNLVGNALKFTHRGSVEARLALGRDALRIDVADTGIGIQPSDQTRIFEMFRQADGSDTRRFGGSGLGLYIVRRFAEQLGGAVSVRSVPGQGSTFTVVLPVLRAATQHAA